MLLLSLAFLTALLLQERSHRKERDRLVRLAAANTHAERLAALLPEKSSVTRRTEPRPETPAKPLGI